MKCSYCGGKLKARGASDSSGGKSFKCRSCGRTHWEWVIPVPPTPLVYEERRKNVR
jgi:tRNA(Ile2) C34 agmatinyltransferase TiaS